MKSLKYLLISVLTICVSSDVLACWQTWYYPSGYYMYSLYDVTPKYDSGRINTGIRGANENCEQWQRLTSSKISSGDIYEVVYNMPLDELEKVSERRDSIYENKFTEWITKRDTTILDFLLLAKNNEHIRFRHNSQWYYPTMNTGGQLTLDEIAEKALSMKIKRLRDRYLLQAIRAMFTMRKYDECIKLWEEEVKYLPENNLMRQLIHPYIAGALYHVKRSEKAVEYFAQLGDVQSLLYCLGRSGENLSTVEALELVCEYSPNSPYIKSTLHGYVGGMEPYGDVFGNDVIRPDKNRERLYWLCIKMAENDKVEEPAMWYYTAAFLSDLDGLSTRAAYLLDLAERKNTNKSFGDILSVFRIYIDAKTSIYDSAYEAKLFKQLKWLDGKICNNINKDVRDEVVSGYKLFSNESFYYWNDMLRRILLAEVCPRMIKVGKTTKALQLANMADNRLFGLINKREGRFYTGDYGWKIYDSMTEYRYSESFNSIDYSNHFFEMIDSIGVNNVIEYVQNVHNPQTQFDRFLNNRGYTGSDYLNDIVGTQYLRNMRYGEAVKYLSKVSKAYEYHHNVYIDHDPFSMTNVRVEQKSDFRYDFAKEMYRLEKAMSRASDPSQKAEIMLRYAIGLRNSFDNCWALTQYYRGSCYWGRVCKKRYWEGDEYTKSAKKRANELMGLACL